MKVNSEISPLIENIGAMCGEIQFETKAIVSNLEKVAGALRQVEEAGERVRCIFEGESENTPDQLETALELESSAFETLAHELSKCEMDLSDFMRHITEDIKNELCAIKDLVSNHRQIL